MSRGSSGHFSKGHSGYFFHNDRSTETKNSIFDASKNEYSCSAKEALQLYQQELSIRSQKYTEITGQKLQKQTITHRSLIINLEQHHTLQDLKKVKDYLEVSLDTKVLQIAIHRDEGYIDDEGKKHINYHAHIELMGIDRYGISLAQHQNKKNSKVKVEQTRVNRLDSKFYTKFQTFLANTLGMERGKRNSKSRRLDTYEYKAHKAKENENTQELKLTVKSLKKEISNLRNEMKEKNAKLDELGEQKVYTQADYIALNSLKKELKKENLSEIYQEFLKLQKQLKSKDKQLQLLRSEKKEVMDALTPTFQEAWRAGKNPPKEYKKFICFVDEEYRTYEKELKIERERMKTLQTEIDTLKAEKSEIRRNMDEIEQEFRNDIEEYKENSGKKFNLFSFLKEKIISLKANIQALFKENMELKTDNEILKKENEELKEENQELKEENELMKKVDEQLQGKEEYSQSNSYSLSR